MNESELVNGALGPTGLARSFENVRLVLGHLSRGTSPLSRVTCPPGKGTLTRTLGSFPAPPPSAPLAPLCLSPSPLRTGGKSTRRAGSQEASGAAGPGPAMGWAPPSFLCLQVSWWPLSRLIHSFSSPLGLLEGRSHAQVPVRTSVTAGHCSDFPDAAADGGAV